MGSEALEGQVRLVPNASVSDNTANTNNQPYTVAGGMDSLREKMENAGLDFNEALAAQQSQVVDFITEQISEQLTKLIMDIATK